MMGSVSLHETEVVERVVVVHTENGVTVIVLGTEGGTEAVEAALGLVGEMGATDGSVWVVDVASASVRPVLGIELEGLA